MHVTEDGLGDVMTRKVRLKNKDDVLSMLGRHKKSLKALGVNTLALFGSAARGEARPDSDLDFLVEFGNSPTFDQYMSVKIFLEDVLQCKVDLVTREALKPRLKPYIEREAVYVT